jgi:uncharacterized protein (DUF169 family)
MIAKTDWAHLSSELTKALRLDRQPVGVKLLRTRAEVDAWDVADARASTYYCAAVKQACGGRAVKLGRDQFTCESSRQILGLEALPHEPHYSASYSECGLHRDKQVSDAVMGDIAVVPRTVLGIVVQPVALFTGQGPDVVIVMGNAYQSMRLVQGFTFHHGELPALRSIGQHGICSESTAEPLLSGTLNVSLLCSGTRFFAKWADDEVATSLPGSLFAQTVDGVLQTINPCEPDNRKRVIAQNPPDTQIDMGCSYYTE